MHQASPREMKENWCSGVSADIKSRLGKSSGQGHKFDNSIGQMVPFVLIIRPVPTLKSRGVITLWVGKPEIELIYLYRGSTAVSHHGTSFNVACVPASQVCMDM